MWQRLKPRLPKVDVLLAMSLSELGRYEEALPALTNAFSQSADPVLQRMAGLHLQRIYTGLGRDRDAVDVALRLSRLHPDDPEVLYHSGRLFANFAYLQTMRLAAVAPDSVWLHQAAGEANESLVKKAARRLDNYLPLSGHNGVTPENDALGVVNVRYSRFLLPVPARSRVFARLCQRRTEACMTHAASTGHIFHLWWHPHNFGSHVDDNLAVLRTTMERYRALSEEQGMVSRTMGEIAAATRPGVTRQLESLVQAAAPRPEVVETAQVSAAVP